jgi:hypothetical protein
MANPEYAASGTLLIPIDVFNQWAQTFLPAGSFYTFDKVKVKEVNLEITYVATSNPPGTGTLEPVVVTPLPA